MSYTNGYESLLWKVLEKEQLADLSQFHRAHFFDEVPLYSRETDVAFLPASRARANAALLRFSLKFLQAVISYGEVQTPFFAAVTIWDGSEEDLIQPNLFVWSGPPKKLKQKLELDAPATAFGKEIQHQLSKLRLRDRFAVREDTTTAAGIPRVFLAPARRPYPAFATLADFRKPARSGKRQRAANRPDE